MHLKNTMHIISYTAAHNITQNMISTFIRKQQQDRTAKNRLQTTFHSFIHSSNRTARATQRRIILDQLTVHRATIVLHSLRFFIHNTNVLRLHAFYSNIPSVISMTTATTQYGHNTTNYKTPETLVWVVTTTVLQDFKCSPVVSRSNNLGHSVYHQVVSYYTEWFVVDLSMVGRLCAAVHADVVVVGSVNYEIEQHWISCFPAFVIVGRLALRCALVSPSRNILKKKHNRVHTLDNGGLITDKRVRVSRE